MTDTPAEGSRDASWVIVDTPLDLASLRAFCRDVERLLRINPLLEFSEWRSSGDEAYHAQFRNLSNEQSVTLDMHVEHDSEDLFTLVYDAGVKASTRFALHATASGSSLTITDDYSRLSDTERAQRIGEVDKSLVAWGWALHEYMRRWQRWHRFAAWRWIMQRCWLPMTPRARRISYMLVVITAGEMALVVLAGLIYWIEFR